MSEVNKIKLLENFNVKAVQTLSLDELSKTHMENYPDGTPVGGIYHYALIESILNMLTVRNIPFEVKEIFAANNKFKRSPGVTILPEVEAREGVGSLPSHILRRVFCNINLKGNFTSEVQCYNIAVSYTQLGVCVGFGPHVYACHNQHICSFDQIVSNYTLRGTERLSTLDRRTDQTLMLIERQIEHASQFYPENLEALDKMKNVDMSRSDIFEFIGLLVEERCRCSSANPLVRANRIAPLTSAQINDLCDVLLTAQGFEAADAYDLYQAGTRYLKPKEVPFENIALQSCALYQLINKYINEERRA